MPPQPKGAMLRAMYVHRTSEFDGFVNPVSGRRADATMNHWRLVASYEF